MQTIGDCRSRGNSSRRFFGGLTVHSRYIDRRLRLQCITAAAETAMQRRQLSSGSSTPCNAMPGASSMYSGASQLPVVRRRRGHARLFLRFRTIPSDLPPPHDLAVTSRLRKPTVYPRPSLRTKRYCSAVSYALLNFQ